MQARCSQRRRTACLLAALAVSAACGVNGCADRSPATKPGPSADGTLVPGRKGLTPLPDEIVQPWMKAGAQVGWMQPGAFTFFQAPELGLAGDLPAFRFKTWKPGVLAKLPVPAAAFGLDLGNTEVGDAGLTEVAGLANLQIISLNDTQLTDLGLKELVGLKDLRALYVAGTHLTDVGAKGLAGLKSLQLLDVRRTELTEAGVRELVGLKHLRALALGGPPLTEAALQQLSGFPGLRTLLLFEIEVTDAGVKDLARLKGLQKLSLSRTKITAMGLKEVEKALPDCKIAHYP